MDLIYYRKNLRLNSCEKLIDEIQLADINDSLDNFSSASFIAFIEGNYINVIKSIWGKKGLFKLNIA